MSKNYIIRSDYREKNSMDFGKSNIEETSSGTINESYTRKLSIDTDIFSKLPKDVFKNQRVNQFLLTLKRVVADADLEFNESTISIEWIFNYFRAYFSFEKDDEDSYGMIENNTETQEFSNYFRRLKPEEYNVVARSVLDYIIMMGGFGQR